MLTPAQEQAIQARGNVLVVAGAGTGKTRTLVERCLNCLLAEQPRASLDEILMVTFTEAAAAEMRLRIRARLEQALAASPGDTHWPEQLALFETAHIGTLHGFCLQLVRQHFYELGLDPQLKVLAEEEARLLAEETLDVLLQGHYAGINPEDEAVRQLIQMQGRGWDKPIRTLVLKLHHYLQTLPDPAGWWSTQRESFRSSESGCWHEWLRGGIAEWRAEWLPLLQTAAAQNDLAAQCESALTRLEPDPGFKEAAECLQAVIAAAEDCPRGKQTLWRKPLKHFLQETDFWVSLLPQEGEKDPLTEDWSWVSGTMGTLLDLAQQFADAFAMSKRESGVLDFHDLEQHALRLLWDIPGGKPTQIARQWREKLRFVFVDEYQDINAAQDKIIEALSHADTDGNRFLVGDVKQSIYRFRQANPRIFQSYIDTWESDRGQTIALADNFRSREGILQFINSLFSRVMRRELGGVPYDQRSELRFGAPSERRSLNAAAQTGPCVELHLRIKGAGENEEENRESAEELAELEDLQEADKEARLVCLRLSELKAQHYPVWDEQTKAFRPVEWSDMAILLRSPANKAESYAKEFSRQRVPLHLARKGFYRSPEILDLLNLLQLLDNPLQDVPAIAVLHSPLVGLDLNELATIRLANLKAHFWSALGAWQRANSPNGPASGGLRSSASEHPPAGSTYQKVTLLLDRFARWRRLARQVSLSRCLEEVLAETHYADWLLTQPRGEHRRAQVQRLIALASQFDQFQRQGLFRFLRFIEAQQVAETEPELPVSSEQNAVRLMSIHQSKGLEFPVLVVADLSKSFNQADLKAEIILDDQFGLCPQIKPPHTGQRYPSLPYWLAQRRQTRELLGEELRLLYVAMTRARDLLILSASTTRPKLERDWLGAREICLQTLISARSYSDWLALWFAQHAPAGAQETRTGESGGIKWILHENSGLLMGGDPAMNPVSEAETEHEMEPAEWGALRNRLAWRYSFTEATREPAKTSVSALGRRAAEEDDEESVPLSTGPGAPQRAGRLKALFSTDSSEMSAKEIGIAHHAFLQLVSLEQTGSIAVLLEQARCLEMAGTLSSPQVASLNLNRLAAFWNSPLGNKVRAQSQFVHRELAFTARFTPGELAKITGSPMAAELAEEFVVIQGVADLVVILPQELWLIDFKTDQIKTRDLKGRMQQYEPQLKLYAGALGKIYRRPVTECWLYFLELSRAALVAT